MKGNKYFNNVKASNQFEFVIITMHHGLRLLMKRTLADQLKLDRFEDIGTEVELGNMRIRIDCLVGGSEYIYIHYSSVNELYGLSDVLNGELLKKTIMGWDLELFNEFEYGVSAFRHSERGSDPRELCQRVGYRVNWKEAIKLKKTAEDYMPTMIEPYQKPEPLPISESLFNRLTDEERRVIFEPCMQNGFKLDYDAIAKVTLELNIREMQQQMADELNRRMALETQSKRTNGVVTYANLIKLHNG